MKRIALGLFMGGMALCAANAAEVRAVASKGYVDTVVGSLSTLKTSDKSNLVKAINELFSGFDSFELLSNKTPTIDENSTAVQYPSAKAVWDKFDALDYTTSGNGPTEGLEIGHAYISRLDQVDGKIQATQQRWTDIIYANTDGDTIRDLDSFTGIEGRIPVPAEDIVRALMVLRSEIPSLDGVETTSNITQTVDERSTATQYPSAKAVYTAVNAKQDKSTEDYQVGKADGTWRTLTADEIAALQSGVKTSTVSQVATNTTELGNKLNVDQGEENGHKVMVTDETGKIIPAPLEACSDESSKCVLTFGVRADGAVGYEWEVIAR